MNGTPSAIGASGGHVFVSYSRKDQDIVDELVSILEHRGERVWLDRERIPDAMKWMEQIRFAIVDARACLFLLSRHSLESEIWNAELKESIRHGKRLVPVLISDVPPALVPEVLREIQWVDLRKTSDLDASVDSLIETVSRDPEWVSTHTRFAIKAAEWNRTDGSKGPLLRGAQLKVAETWLEDPDTLHQNPSLTENQITFIRESIAARKRRTVVSIVALALGVVIALIALDQYRQAEHRERIASAERIASRANQALGETGPDLLESTALAMQSLTVAETDAGVRTLRRNLALLPERPVLIAELGEPIRSLAFSPDAGMLIVGTETKGARLCDVTTLACARTLNVSGIVRHIRFSDDGRLIFMVGVEAVVWELDSLDEPIFKVGDPRDQAHAYAVSPDFGFVAVGDQYGYGEIRSVSGRERHHLTFDATAFAMAFSENGELLATGDSRGKVQIWLVPSGEPAKCPNATEQLSFSHKQRINTLVFVPGETFEHSLAAGSGNSREERTPDNGTNIWRMCDPAPAKRIQHETPVHTIAFTTNGKLLASVSDQEVVLSEYEPNMRGAPTQWHVGRIRFDQKAHVRPAAFLPGTRQLASGWVHEIGGTVLISEAAIRASPTEPNVREVRRLPLDSPPYALAISGDARLLATGEDNGRVLIWRTRPKTEDLSGLSARELVHEACRRLPARMRDSLRREGEGNALDSSDTDRNLCETDG